MDLLCALASAKKAYGLYKEITTIFIDETEIILTKVAKKECASAILTLNECRCSNDKQRELGSAITQLRLAQEKSDSILFKCKITAIIALCYRALGDEGLMMLYKDKTMQYFQHVINQSLNQWEMIEKMERIPLFLGRGRLAEITVAINLFNSLVADLQEIGISSDFERLDYLDNLHKSCKEISTLGKKLCTDSQERFKAAIEAL